MWSSPEESALKAPAAPQETRSMSENSENEVEREKEVPPNARYEGNEVCSIEMPTQDEEGGSFSFMQRQAMRMARWPKTHFWVAFLIALIISVVGFIVGEFSVSNQEGGWQSRGTLIAGRQTQVLLVIQNEQELAGGSDAVWEDFINNVQPGWEEDDDIQRRLTFKSEEEEEDLSFWDALVPQISDSGNSYTMSHGRDLAVSSSRRSPALLQLLRRRLQQDNIMAGCDFEWYLDGRMQNGTRLSPVWKATKGDSSILDPPVLQELCEAELKTQRVLEEKNLCIPCNGEGKCLPPYSPVFYARSMVDNGFSLDCAQLASAWKPFQEEVEQEWGACVKQIEQTATIGDACPDNFDPSLMDELVDETGNVQYTSTIFATTESMADDLYDINDEFGRGGKRIEGAYDTTGEDFLNILADTAVSRDMLLATGSAFITMAAMLIHTRSPFLTVVGLVQIMLSFPLAFFAYRFILGFTFFPFLNFIGVFVVFALGADHVFVAVDKWKNARNDHPNYTIEQVAAKALPEAASAMFLTTSTTAVAFFGTAICPVAPVRLFAIFCGLLITFDYIMDVLLIFPCLCIYDGYRHNLNCCITLTSCCQKRKTTEKEQEDVDGQEQTNVSAAIREGAENEEDMKPSFIRRVLTGYYGLLHRFRWPIFVASTTAFAVCCYFASTLRLPKSGDVRLMSDDIEFEKAFQWRANLLSGVIEQQGGSVAFVIWGTTPADTGDLSNPESFSTLELDETFDISSPEAQQYMVNFCPHMFAEDFATPPSPGWECPINRFDSWLANQTASIAPTAAYQQRCDGASGLPMNQEYFHACFSGWSQLVDETSVLSRNGIVEIMYVPFNSRVRYDSPSTELGREWDLIQDWMDKTQAQAPNEVNKAFFSSTDFWWYDTNQAMFTTAYGSAAIALAAAAVIILISSRSFVMTLFSVISICYVLVSVTSMMVASGWTLGFLESICFAILIGVSVDFVIHFSHAYTSIAGEASRESRTKHALIDMGPSILAAAFTTIAGATIMLFCIITFFTKFALVLFFTIVQATLGSFVVFLTLTDCIGPTRPTHFADKLVEKLRYSSGKDSVNGKKETSTSTGEVSADSERQSRENNGISASQNKPKGHITAWGEPLPPTDVEV